MQSSDVCEGWQTRSSPYARLNKHDGLFAQDMQMSYENRREE